MGNGKRASEKEMVNTPYKYMGRDSVIAGAWKDDKYIGERALASYVIEYRNSIGRVTCMRVGDRLM